MKIDKTVTVTFEPEDIQTLYELMEAARQTLDDPMKNKQWYSEQIRPLRDMLDKFFDNVGIV